VRTRSGIARRVNPDHPENTGGAVELYYEDLPSWCNSALNFGPI
jgi:hypothetical protein